jgi:hypothetical protein
MDAPVSAALFVRACVVDIAEVPGLERYGCTVALPPRPLNTIPLAFLVDHLGVPQLGAYLLRLLQRIGLAFSQFATLCSHPSLA